MTVLLVDVSGSMTGYCAMGNGTTRWQALQRVLADLNLPCPRIAFGVLDTPSGVRALGPRDPLPLPAGGTPLDAALDCARQQAAHRAVVISDGEPNDPPAALQAARAFGRRIDVFYVGPENGPGQAFLAQLAHAAGGTMNQTDLREPARLAAGLRGLLTGGLA